MQRWKFDDGVDWYLAHASEGLLRIEVAHYDEHAGCYAPDGTVEQSLASFVATGPSRELAARVSGPFLATIARELESPASPAG